MSQDQENNINSIKQNAHLVLRHISKGDKRRTQRSFKALKEDIKILVKDSFYKIEKPIMNLKYEDPVMEGMREDINTIINALIDGNKGGVATTIFKGLEAKVTAIQKNIEANRPSPLTPEEVQLSNDIKSDMFSIVQSFYDQDEVKAKQFLNQANNSIFNLKKSSNYKKKEVITMAIDHKDNDETSRMLEEKTNILLQNLFNNDHKNSGLAFEDIRKTVEKAIADKATEKERIADIEETNKVTKAWQKQQLKLGKHQLNKAKEEEEKDKDFAIVKKAKTKLEDIAGLDHIMKDITDIIDMIKNMEKYSTNGATIPKGTLLTGGPGVGKTMIARAISNESGVPMIPINGSDFVEMYVGVGPKRIRQLFKNARKVAKEEGACIIFIDEIDALGGDRNSHRNSGEDNKTINAILTEMDGFDDSAENKNIIIIAATNRPDILDEAVTRDGRFDREIEVPLPDLEAREKIALVYTKGKKLYNEATAAQYIAKKTFGKSGATIKSILNEAAINQTKNNKPEITKEILAESVDKKLMGIAGKMTTNEETKTNTAYHEAAHALVGMLLEKYSSTQVQNATILPRGKALGYVSRTPKDDSLQETKLGYLAFIHMALAGRVAEELLFGDKFSGGAKQDLKVATNTLAEMTVNLGMFEEEYGIGSFSDVFNSASNTNNNNKLKKFINDKLKDIKKDVEKIIIDNEDALHKLAQALVNEETLDKEQITKALGKLTSMPNTFSDSKTGTIKPRIKHLAS